VEYSIRREPPYLLVSLSGTPSERELRAVIVEMARSMAGTSGALVEARVASGLDLLATKALVTGGQAMGIPQAYRVALLLLDDGGRESAQFAEDVAVNRGLSLRVFREREKALAWLAG